MKRTRIIIVSDMHIGSIYGLAPLTSVPQDKQSPFILWVNDKWLEFSESFYNPDYLLLLGDLADGSQVKILGSDALTTNLDDQEAMAIEMIKLLVGEKTQIYGINGSGYHGAFELSLA
jgi:predicted MPP superfamily phosphohydrolase